MSATTNVPKCKGYLRSGACWHYEQVHHNGAVTGGNIGHKNDDIIEGGVEEFKGVLGFEFPGNFERFARSSIGRGVQGQRAGAGADGAAMVSCMVDYAYAVNRLGRLEYEEPTGSLVCALLREELPYV